MTWNEEEMKKLKKENYAEYRKIYCKERMKNTKWYCGGLKVCFLNVKK